VDRWSISVSQGARWILGVAGWAATRLLKHRRRRLSDAQPIGGRGTAPGIALIATSAVTRYSSSLRHGGPSGSNRRQSGSSWTDPDLHLPGGRSRRATSHGGTGAGGRGGIGGRDADDLPVCAPIVRQGSPGYRWWPPAAGCRWSAAHAQRYHGMDHRRRFRTGLHARGRIAIHDRDRGCGRAQESARRRLRRAIDLESPGLAAGPSARCHRRAGGDPVHGCGDRAADSAPRRRWCPSDDLRASCAGRVVPEGSLGLVQFFGSPASTRLIR